MFVDDITERINSEAYNILSKTGVGSYEEMYGFLTQFPSIAKGSSISLPSLSNIAAIKVSTAVRGIIQMQIQSPPSFAKGVFSPPQSQIGNGYQQPLPSGSPSAVGVPSTPIVIHLTTPVRDQGQRATCVAHAVVACVEAHILHADLSEQFKYWASKKHGGDPFPDQEGTWLVCAKNALESKGVCDESLWLYNPNHILGNETQEILGKAPSTGAVNNAVSRKVNSANYRDTSSIDRGKALILAQELNKGPVAATLPVFFDSITGISNWDWFGACAYGHVLDPTPFSYVRNGHAICVCEYLPSNTAPGRGWFVFKNSWGTQHWSNGNSSPPQGHPQWKSGYGYLSAAYVDEFLWELLLL